MAVIVVAVVSSGGESRDAGSSDAEGASTTMPRTEDARLLDEYCDRPGAKWAEVPAYDPAAASSTHVVFEEEGLDNGFHDQVASESSRSGEPGNWGGRTAISPKADGTFEAAGAAEVRTVTCVSLVGTESVGKTCEFVTGPGAPVVGAEPASAGLELARNRFSVTVYELRSGGVLHKGEIVTPTELCPESLLTEEGQALGAQVAYGLTQQDALTWLGAHFVDGKPA
jgi:hypothetical protein